MDTCMGIDTGTGTYVDSGKDRGFRHEQVRQQVAKNKTGGGLMTVSSPSICGRSLSLQAAWSACQKSSFVQPAQLTCESSSLVLSAHFLMIYLGHWHAGSISQQTIHLIQILSAGLGSTMLSNSTEEGTRPVNTPHNRGVLGHPSTNSADACAKPRCSLGLQA